MALEFIEVAAERLSPGYSVLDAGTGTGVLAIAAVSLGAGPVTAFDVDQSAVAVARRNFGLNLEPDGIRPEITLFVGEIAAARGKFDLVLANLAAPLLLRIRDELTAKVGKMLILSGIAEALSAQTLESYAETGLRLKATVSRDGWHAALFE
jgi:ribosomal protein L11 methyltransferase